MSDPLGTTIAPLLTTIGDFGASPRACGSRRWLGLMAVAFSLIYASPLATGQTTLIRPAANWNYADAWSNGIPDASTGVIINHTANVYLPSLLEEGQAFARSLTIIDADSTNDQIVSLSHGILNLTPAASPTVTVGIASPLIGEPRSTYFVVDDATLNSTGFANIGRGLPVGTGSVLLVEMELKEHSNWFHPSGLIEVGAGGGTGHLRVDSGSLLAGGVIPGQGQDPRLSIAANSWVWIEGVARFEEISVNSTSDGFKIAEGLKVALPNLDSINTMLETNRLKLGETERATARLEYGTYSSLGEVTIDLNSELKAFGTENADSIKVNDGVVVLWNTTVGDPSAPGDPFAALLQLAANQGSSAYLSVGHVTVHGSAVLGGYGTANVDCESGGVLDIRGQATLGLSESSPGGAAGSGIVNITGLGSVLRAQSYRIGHSSSPEYLHFPAPQGALSVGDRGRVEVTGTLLEYDAFILGHLVHVIAHNAGTMTVGRGGTLDFLDGSGKVVFTDPSNGATQTGTQELINYGLIKGGDATAPDLESGGHIDCGAQGGTLVNLGTIAPGHSSGWLKVNGNLTFRDFSSPSAGRVVIELGGATAGSGYDVLEVSGNVDLTDATLEIRLANGYVPPAGAVFDFLHVGGGLNGAFAQIVNATGLEFTFTGTPDENGWLRLVSQGGIANASVTLGNLAATYTGSPIAATATTSPDGLAVVFTYDGAATIPTNVGSYAVVATINDANHSGTASGTLIIAKANATVTLGNLAATYDGSAHAATATTDPSGLTVNFVYDGSGTAPTNLGSYEVVGTISSTNYQGSANGTLVISGVAPAITLQPVSQAVTADSLVTFTAAAGGVPAPTFQWRKNGVNLAGATSSTYAIGSANAGDAGSYSVVATNSAGTATSVGATLTVQAAAFNLAGSIWLSPAGGLTGLWLMNGTTVSSGVSLGTMPTAWQVVAAADFNGDGQPDILWQNTATGQRRIWLMNGTTFSSEIDLGTYDPSWQMVTTVDFNGDGQPDILWQNTTTGQRTIWLMNGTTYLDAVDFGIYAVSWQMVTAVDFNGDGQPDILWQNTVTGQHTIWLMNGTTYIGAVDLGQQNPRWRAAGAADFNGDGQPDILWQAGSAAGDFNGDGHHDILWQNTATGQRRIWLMNGTAFGSEVAFGTYDTSWQLVSAVDFDGDGQSDVLWQNTTTGQRRIWLMHGTTFSSEVALGTYDVSWQIVAAADFNAGGDPDILWQNTATGQRTIWLMTGTAYIGAIDFGIYDVSWQIVTAADFDGDGHPDILWQNTTTGQRTIWLMSGTTFNAGIDFGTYDVNWQMVAAADFNDDSQTDILWQNTATGQRTIWLMNGTTFGSGVDLGTYDLNWQIAP